MDGFQSQINKDEPTISWADFTSHESCTCSSSKRPYDTPVKQTYRWAWSSTRDRDFTAAIYSYIGDINNVNKNTIIDIQLDFPFNVCFLNLLIKHLDSGTFSSLCCFYPLSVALIQLFPSSFFFLLFLPLPNPSYLSFLRICQLIVQLHQLNEVFIGVSPTEMEEWLFPTRALTRWHLICISNAVIVSIKVKSFFAQRTCRLICI